MLMIFGIQIDNFDPYNVFLAIQVFLTGFVLHGQICCLYIYSQIKIYSDTFNISHIITVYSL